MCSNVLRLRQTSPLLHAPPCCLLQHMSPLPPVPRRLLFRQTERREQRRQPLRHRAHVPERCGGGRRDGWAPLAMRRRLPGAKGHSRGPGGRLSAHARASPHSRAPTSGLPTAAPPVAVTHPPTHPPLPRPYAPAVFPNIPAPGGDNGPTFSECARKHLAAKPRKGSAVLFHSIKPSGEMERRSLHTACPVIKGEKWSAPKVGGAGAGAAGGPAGRRPDPASSAHPAP